MEGWKETKYNSVNNNSNPVVAQGGVEDDEIVSNNRMSEMKHLDSDELPSIDGAWECLEQISDGWHRTNIKVAIARGLEK